MKVLKIIDFYLNRLMQSRPSPKHKLYLDRLVYYLKVYRYPNIELSDILSIRIMLDYLLNDNELIEQNEDFIKTALRLINDILSDRLYVKIEPEIIALESEFYINICICQRQFENRLTEEIRKLILE